MPENHYSMLGVSRDATAEQIKKAYRTLARKYHPDLSKEADAEARMQEINVAYDVLGDENKKRQYDFELNQPQGNFGSYGQNSGSSQQGFAAEDYANFEDLFGRFGSGFGGSDFQYQRQQRSYRGEDQHATIEVDIAVAFNGSHEKITLQIPTLNAAGHAEVQRKVLEVNIPKGLKDGQQIRLSGQGQSGSNGQNGDLYLEIHYRSRPELRVEGADLYQQLNISPWEAALGAAIQITTLAGDTLQVQLPKDAYNGQQLRLKDKGIPNKTAGHLYLVLNIVIPSINNSEQQQAYTVFAESFQTFKPRQS